MIDQPNLDIQAPPNLSEQNISYWEAIGKPVMDWVKNLWKSRRRK